MRLLEGEGYQTMRAAGSHGVFDIIGWDATVYKMVQVKLETPPSRAELADMVDTVVPPNAQKLIHLWRKVKGKIELFVTIVGLVMLSGMPLVADNKFTSEQWTAQEAQGAEWATELEGGE